MVNSPHEPMPARGTCRHITMNGEGILCSEPGVRNCWHCKEPICLQHARWRRPGGMGIFNQAYCIPCDEAAKAGKLHL